MDTLETEFKYACSLLTAAFLFLMPLNESEQSSLICEIRLIGRIVRFVDAAATVLSLAFHNRCRLFADICTRSP
jgi:hypothetical protein